MTTTSSTSASSILSAAAATQAANKTTASQATGSAGSAVKFAADMDSFLKLLTAQLQNQDPLQPLDANDFTAQLAQYSGVEQQIATNKNMEALLDVQRSNALVSASSLVGEEVQVASDRVGLLSGTAQALQLPATTDAGGARQATITVTNTAGTVLRQTTVALGSSATAWTWDGKDAQGRRLADGTYKVSVSGTDAAGTATGALDFTVKGTVNSVSRGSGDPMLSIGSLSVSYGSLRRI